MGWLLPLGFDYLIRVYLHVTLIDSTLLIHSPVLFTCPQQPSLKLSPSKIDDGICDCCDGADESSVKCPDDCQAILAEERRKRQAMQNAYMAGARQRQKDLEEYAALVRESEKTLETKRAELQKVQTKRAEAQDALRTAKTTWIRARLAAYQTRVKALFGSSEAPASLPDLRDLLEPLTTTELRNLIVHACQLAGEISAGSKHQTCAPLRLAGLAAGVAWEPKTYTMIQVSEDTMGAWADLMHHNMKNPRSIKWHVNAVGEDDKNGRRRLDDYDEGFYDEENMYGDYDPDDFDEDEEEELYYERDNDVEEKEGDSNQRETLTAWVKEQPFSVPRVRFLTRTDALLARLDELTKDKEETEEGDDSPQEAPEPPAGFDPMAAPLLRSQINRRRDAIEKGLAYAVSARVLLKDLEDRNILQSLLYGVWFHGKLSAWHMWQAYQAVIPELGGTSEEDTEICRAVWACPPGAATRTLGRQQVTLPPAFLVQVADEHCRAMAMQDTDASTVCAADDGAVPPEIMDGLYGYYAVEARPSEDAANVLFEGLAWEEDSSGEYSKVQQLMDSVDELEKQESDLEREIARINDEIGQDDDGNNKYGGDGELYSLRQTCLEMPAGKYIYELCLFKSSKQKEGKHSGGTDLGQWSGASVTDDGQRVWSWENGAKCWNGPKRSAWAYLTCGATTKIISADEPETCKYVFEVESHIACDEAYRLKKNLA